MSIAVMTRVWAKSKQKSGALLLMLALADFANDDGIAWPSVKTLAAKSRLSERQCQRIIDRLQAKGELYAMPATGRGHTNLYFVAVGLDQPTIHSTLKGEVFTPFKIEQKGDISDGKRVTSATRKGDIAVTPDPSLDPSVDPSISQASPADAFPELDEPIQNKVLDALKEKQAIENLKASLPVTDKPAKRPTDPYYVFQTVDGKSVYTGPFKGLEPAKRFAAGNGTVTQKQAIPPGAAVRPVPRAVQPWDALGKAIARTFFGATDDASVNAVMGRVAPILHGDKRGGRCMGIIAYECERQKVARDALDFAALTAFVTEVWNYYQSQCPGKPLKDCVKVLDYWQASRVREMGVAMSQPSKPVRPGDELQNLKLVEDPTTGALKAVWS